MAIIYFRYNNVCYALDPETSNAQVPSGAEIVTEQDVIDQYGSCEDCCVCNPPIAQDDAAATTENVPVNINVLANDSDPLNLVLTIVAFDAVSAQSGTVSLNTGVEPGDPADDYLVYVPASGFDGIDTFTYTIENECGQQDVATVTVTVSPIVPTPTPDSNTGPRRPTPTPTPTATQSPTPTPTPTPDVTPEPTPMGTPVPTPTPTATPIATPTPTPDNCPDCLTGQLTITPNIMSGVVMNFCGGVSIPAGTYRISYVSGRFRLAPDRGYELNSDNFSGFKIVYNNGTSEVFYTDNTGEFDTSSPNNASFDAAFVGSYRDIEHTGGTIGMYLLDDDFDDNTGPTTFNLECAPPEPTATPSALVARLLVGGDFTQAGGESASRIAQWDGDSWLPFGSGFNGTVRVLKKLANGTIYAGGSFTTAGGASISYLAKWDGSEWTALGGGVNGSVRDLKVLPDGTLLVVGDFTQAGGESANRIARFDGVVWTTYGTGLNSSVLSAAVKSNGNIVVGGTFSTAGGVTAENLAEWNGISWSPLGGGANATVHRILIDSSQNVIAVGEFTTLGGAALLRIVGGTVVRGLATTAALTSPSIHPSLLRTVTSL
ncbi:MAG: cadherin-like domain-containing protein [Candidatus Competibacteraceae bacterium]|nr:cadherin-like domain-containing protein [Candidatus Competibacteraceae bacterium]